MAGFIGMNGAGVLGGDQLARIESLGDNCELGFVLRRLGHNSGSLFRWASMKPPQLLAMLRADLTGIYEFDELEPLRLSMVLDRRYGVGWHTDMAIALEDGRLAFQQSRKARRAVHRQEGRKIDYLTAKLRSRARCGGVVFVIKSNPGIDRDIVGAIRNELVRLCEGSPSTLLEVSSTDNPALVGTVQPATDGLLRGFVRAFAPYERADEGDTEVWASLLEQALELSPCPDWKERLEAAQAGDHAATSALPFPGDDGVPAAIAELVGGNEWCRRVGDDFRLHGAPLDGPGTSLRWSSLDVASRSHLSGTIRSAFEDAVPVSVTVRVRNAESTDVRELRSVVSPGKPWLVDLSVDPDELDEIVLELDAAATRPLASGERAVIDISPLCLHKF